MPLTGLHTKERCPSCGVWKHKQRDCGVCTKFPNRAQAIIAQERHVPADLTPIGIGTPGDAAVMPKDIWRHRASSSSSSKLHIKERCPGCGLWKHKQLQCSFCITRPSRAQAQNAQFRQATQTRPALYTEEARQRAALIGSSQRPKSAPAYESTNSELMLFSTTPHMLSTVGSRPAQGVSAYRESRLYRTPSGLRKIAASNSKPSLLGFRF